MVLMENIEDNVQFKCGGRELKILKKFEKFELVRICFGVDDAFAYRFRSINWCVRLHFR